LNPRIFKLKLQDNLKEKNEIFRKVYQYPEFPFEGIYKDYLGYGRKLAQYICDTSKLVNQAIQDKKDILFEGAQGTFLDIDFGTYPFVTSSSTISGGACIGTGVSPRVINKIIGIAKAYTTRVGEGPFPTEFSPSFSQFIRNKGKEFGATTGRPRRCGWFDSILVKEAVMLNGITELAIMKMDILDGLKTIKVCTGYKYKGKKFHGFPYDLEVLKNATCIYKEFPGWDIPLREIKQYKDLPRNAKNYLMNLQDMLGAKITLVSVGSSRDESIFI